MLEEVGIPRLVVAGVRSGSGKTSITLGLVAVLRSRGREVQTFKVGPDFIDCAYLAHASRRPCRNIDSWMLGDAGVRRSLAQGVVGADCAVIEGVGGFYDGHGMYSEAGVASGSFPGSTAEVARLISAPAVLVLDAWAMGETAAAVALGIKQLDVSSNVVGVILNNVPSDYRRRVVEDAVWNLARLPVLGALPRLDSVHIPELRTGLLPLTQNPHVDEAISQLGAAVNRHCDVDLIERLMARARPLQLSVPQRRQPTVSDPPRIGVAFDDAFCFYYAENLELLEDAGAEVVTFSPLEDRALPRDLDALYLGGGVSEAYVARLSSNRAFIDSFRRARTQGIPTYAECGGLLYCARSLRTSDGSVHAMAGAIPADIALEAGALHSGYRDLRIASSCMLGPVGTRLRGHEFHFARLLSAGEGLNPAYTMHDSDGEPLGCEGWATGGIVASLVHLHFGQDPALARRFVEAARTARARRDVRASELSPV